MGHYTPISIVFIVLRKLNRTELHIIITDIHYNSIHIINIMAYKY